jgi:hypothetical protein
MSRPFIGDDTGIKWNPPKRRPKEKIGNIIAIDPSFSNCGVAASYGGTANSGRLTDARSMSGTVVGDWLTGRIYTGALGLIIEDVPMTQFFKPVHALIEEIVRLSRQEAVKAECELLICRVMPKRWRTEIGIPEPPKTLGRSLSVTKRRHLRRAFFKGCALRRATEDYPDVGIGGDDDKAEALCILTWALKEFGVRGLI